MRCKQAFIWLLAVAATQQGFAQQNYVIVDLGDMDYPWSINDRGQVVGEASGGVPGIRARLWENGQITDLGTLGGDSWALDINNSGQAVGASYPPSGPHHAVLWENGVLTDLGTFGGGHSEARSINNSGQVVGWAEDDAGQWRAFLWKNGTMTDLGSLGGPPGQYYRSEAYDINDNGLIVGWTDTPDVLFQACVFNAGTITTVFMDPEWAWGSVARSINSLGQVVGGAMWGTSLAPPFLWENGTTTNLTCPCADTRVCRPYSINDLGQVVGFSCEPWLWQDGVMVNLNDLLVPGSGWYLSAPRHINNLGQIVGEGTINRDGRTFLLSPWGADLRADSNNNGIVDRLKGLDDPI